MGAVLFDVADRARRVADCTMPELRPEVLAYYEMGREAGRLTDGSLAGPLEFARTTELLTKYLPPAPLNVIDVGGGPGSYSAWLTERGDQVLLVDPVSLHVEQAQARSLNAELGDARALRGSDDSFDVVLLMGPLYHLTDAAERAQALSEARRVLRPGGLLIATAISRFAALLDILVRLDRLHAQGVMEQVEEAVTTGVFHGREGGKFTTAFFHLPTQLRKEVADAGFEDPEVLSIEGPGFLVSNFDERWEDPIRRSVLLRAARLVEAESEMLGASSHLMAVARAGQN